MLTVDITLPDVEELLLVTEGQGEGVPDLRRDRRGLEEVDLTKEQVEDFYTYLIDHGVELVEGVEHKTPPHEQPALAEDSKAAAPKLDLTVEPSLSSCGSTCARSGRCRSGRRPGGPPREAHRAW